MTTNDKKKQTPQPDPNNNQGNGLGNWIMSNITDEKGVSANISGEELNKALDSQNKKQEGIPGETKTKKKQGVLDWITSNINVPKEISTARLNICKSCEKFRPTTKTCQACNCFMPGKVHINSASCPDGKWGRAIKI